MYKKAFAILKNNTIFIQPVLIWQIISAAVLYISADRIQTPVMRAVMYISLLCLLILCLAGWFYINKYAVLSYKESDSDDETACKTIENFHKFFEGAGSDYVRIAAAGILLFFVYAAVFFGIYKFCVSNFGMPEFADSLAAANFDSAEKLMQFIDNISDADKIIFMKWAALMSAGSAVLNFLSLLYFAVMSFERKNFIVSFFTAVKFFIVNIFESAAVIIFTGIIYSILNIIYAQFAANTFMFALFIILLVLYFNYYVLLVFCFYYDKTKKVQDSSSNGSNGVGQDEACSQAC